MNLVCLNRATLVLNLILIFIIMKNHDDLQSSFGKSDRLKIDDRIFVINAFD